MAPVQVQPVRSRAELETFIRLPWRLYDGDRNWVPPIRSEQRRLLTPGRHPFWEHAERQLLLAWRDGQAVGRIAAIHNHTTNPLHPENVGTWGFFESERDPEVAVSLLTAAEQWLRARGLRASRGPMSPSMTYEVGLLVEGFDTPPTLMMTYNPPWYTELVTLAGYRKEKDLLAFLYPLGSPIQIPEWAAELARKLTQRGELTLRHGRRWHFRDDLRLMNQIYETCWRDNWGYTSASDAEIVETARSMVHIVDFDLTFFLYHRGTPVAVCVLLPDINQLLGRCNGRGGLAALLTIKRHWGEMDGLRGLMFGVLPEYRQTGVPLVALEHLRRILAAKPQYRWVELGWDLEDNDAINQLYIEGGLRPHKRWRVYRKDLA